MKDNHEFRVIRLRELPLALPCCDCPERIYEYWMANISSAGWYNPDVETLCATVKRVLDEAITKIDGAKGQIQLSPEYRGEATRDTPEPATRPPSPTPPPPTRYYVYLDDQVKGPYSREQMAALCNVGMIRDETLCCVENTTEWKPCTTVFERLA